ncbi:Protein abscisic acid-insensitive 5 [Vitis vinifera]|uniref:Protein abscisic acid-insensitive 5 n=1 Tax=Vitis vinifera TaxID=29760 RepID=A0A438JS35_VITVI|nr:Protein abscisic acid-insensitive 5 [Vitis vinifera]
MYDPLRQLARSSSGNRNRNWEVLDERHIWLENHLKGVCLQLHVTYIFLQAYTVELEAELNQLKEENTLLQQALAKADFERKRKQQVVLISSFLRQPLLVALHQENPSFLEELKMKTQTKAEKAKEKMKKMRKTWSCPL